MPTQIDPQLWRFHKQLLLVVTERIYRVKKSFSRLKDFKRICISKLIDTLKMCTITVILLQPKGDQASLAELLINCFIMQQMTVKRLLKSERPNEIAK